MKRVCYVILVSATLYLAALYNSPAIVFLAGVELLLPLFLFLLLFVGNFLLRIRFVNPLCFFQSGEEVVLGVRLTKRGLLPLRQVRFGIRGVNRILRARCRRRERLSVERGENPVREILLPDLGYGVWHFSLKGIRVFDYIRLWALPHPCSQETVCVVLPKYIPLQVGEEGAGPREGEWEAAEKPSWEYDRADRGELRSYRPGDALSEIHWKLSAKRDELLVWERQRRGQGGWLVGLDLSELGPRTAELVYSLLVSLYRQLGSGGVLLGQKGEACLICLTEEREVDLAMARLMEDPPSPLGETEGLPAASLWVREPLSLWQGQQRLKEFSGLSEEAWEETLLNMELKL